MGAYGAEIMPAGGAEDVLPSDSVNFSREAEGIYVGGTGDVNVIMPGGTAILFSGAPAGTILPVRAIRVNLTDTTATKMVALFTRSR